jgi:hypothetical protein
LRVFSSQFLTGIIFWWNKRSFDTVVSHGSNDPERTKGATTMKKLSMLRSFDSGGLIAIGIIIALAVLAMI